MNHIFDSIGQTGLVPVITIDDADKAQELGAVLGRSGLRVAEITFRTAAAEESIRRMSDACPDVVVGAGTVINVELAKKAVAAGARFIVSPGFNLATIDWCLEHDVPVLPGVDGPSAIEAGLGRGLDTFKFFPAEALGGMTMLKAMAAPFGAVRFVPTGGIDQNLLGSYLAYPSVLAVGGSWMVRPELVAAGDWSAIESLCVRAVHAVHNFGLGHVGINSQDSVVAGGVSAILEGLGFRLRDTEMSTFAGGVFEVMKTNYRGRHGHLALTCTSVERALVYLERSGFSVDASTARMEDGRIKAVYLNEELGGFAVHLLRA